MPEEYRVWKEKMDAIEQKRAVQAASQAAAEVDRLADLKAGNKGARAGPASGSGGGNAIAAAVSSVQYASATEAAEAFKDMLAEKKVPTIAKMKEVQDLCQGDERWEALKTQGEKKQALAEYQVSNAFINPCGKQVDVICRTRYLRL